MTLALRTAVYLFIGAAATFGVCAAISLLGSWRDPEIVSGLLTPRGSPESTIKIAQAREPGALVRGIETYEPANGSWPEPGYSFPVAFRSRIGEDHDFAAWGHLARALAGEQVHVTEQARGWPFLAFRAYTGDSANYRGGYTFADPSQWVNSRFAPVIPLTPIPTGLLLDAAFYGGLIAFPIEGLLALRRTRRRRAACCPACGYSRTGIAQNAPCPECGS